jgi:hypothetical protein
MSEQHAALIASKDAQIADLERQCKEWERRTFAALDKLHLAIGQKIGARCEHGVWVADHCWECGKRRDVQTPAPEDPFTLLP